jgi:hypothetical protein
MSKIINLSDSNIEAELMRLRNTRRKIREEESIRIAARRTKTKAIVNIKKYLPTLMDWLKRIEDSRCTPAS